jgi:hypothetical protein
MRGLILLPALTLLVALSGCGGETPVDRFQIKVVEDGQGFTLKTADPLPPLDDGRVELAGPEGWKFLQRTFSYLARFGQGTPNELPRIEVTVVEESPYAEFKTITKDNVVAFAKAIDKKIFAEESPAVLAAPSFEPPKPMIIGGVPCVRYVLPRNIRSRVGGTSVVYLVERQILDTIYNGRLYRVELLVLEGTILRHRDAGYAVLASMKFHDIGEDGDANGKADAGDSDGPAESPFAPKEDKGGQSP